jgi:hypothetical protein
VELCGGCEPGGAGNVSCGRVYAGKAEHRVEDSARSSDLASQAQSFSRECFCLAPALFAVGDPTKAAERIGGVPLVADLAGNLGRLTVELGLRTSVGLAQVAGMDSNPNENRRLGERSHRLLDRGNRLTRPGERVEEAVARAVDLVAVVPCAGSSDDPPLLFDDLEVRVPTELVKQARRAFNVGEHESDRPRRLRNHQHIFRQRNVSDNTRRSDERKPQFEAPAHAGDLQPPLDIGHLCLIYYIRQRCPI